MAVKHGLVLTTKTRFLSAFSSFFLFFFFSFLTTDVLLIDAFCPQTQFLLKCGFEECVCRSRKTLLMPVVLEWRLPFSIAIMLELSKANEHVVDNAMKLNV